jgi:hypothetical protein
MAPYVPDREVGTGVARLLVTTARSLREAGIDEAVEEALDAALLGGHADTVDRLRHYGIGGAKFAARRVARILSPGGESTVGWRALDALALLGDFGLQALMETRTQLPHAESALAFGEAWLRHRRGDGPDPGDLRFFTQLDRVVSQPDQRGTFLVTWTPVDSEIHGSRRLQLFGNGERIVTARPPGAVVGATRRSFLNAMQLQAVVEALRFGAVWLLRPLREMGLPDEPRPTLEVQLGLGEVFSRQIAMWNGEWRLGPASQLAELLDRLSRDASPDSVMPPAYSQS